MKIPVPAGSLPGSRQTPAPRSSRRLHRRSHFAAGPKWPGPPEKRSVSKCNIERAGASRSSLVSWCPRYHFAIRNFMRLLQRAQFAFLRLANFDLHFSILATHAVWAHRAPVSIHQPCFGKFPLAIQDLVPWTIEPHHVIPVLHDGQAIGDLPVASAELDGDGAVGTPLCRDAVE